MNEYEFIDKWHDTIPEDRRSEFTQDFLWSHSESMKSTGRRIWGAILRLVPEWIDEKPDGESDG